MSDPSASAGGALRIVHVFRSPVGGIFRHVRDLVHAQIAAGHSVGLVCDDNTGGAFEERNLADLATHLDLGLHRITMDRSITPRDFGVLWALTRTLARLDAHVLHGHGAKGGAYARVVGTAMRLRGSRPARLYCPHGGSVHYDGGALAGRLYFGLERAMAAMTDGLVFVSDYERAGYEAKVGKVSTPQALVRNGLMPEEFEPVPLAEGASDFLYVGMLRDLKGPDLVLAALPTVAERLGRKVTATIVGDGPERDALERQAAAMNGASVRFLDPMPARQAFALGRVLVVPSRAESMPYIVLEAAAAGKRLLASRVGGVPEIYGEEAPSLVAPDDVEALAEAMAGALSDVDGGHTDALQARVQQNHSLDVMAADVMAAYESALGADVPVPPVVETRLPASIS